jgi:biotin carboxylase
LDRRIVLVMHTTSYGAAGFAQACARAGAGVIVASDRCHVLDRAWRWPTDSLVIDFGEPEHAAETIAAAALAGADRPVVAVLPVGGELPARVAADAARRLGLAANAPEAMRAAGNKRVMRERLAADAGAGRDFRVPRFMVLPRALDPEDAAAAVAGPGGVGFPCVVKPLMLSGSRGVIRADDRAGFARAFARLGRILDEPAVRRIDAGAATQILVESFVPGPELALEGLMSDGTLEVLALFDKPDPLDGPFFEETLYVTPSRLAAAGQERVARAVIAAARALGIATGPIHAELRLGGTTAHAHEGAPEAPPVLIEIAARPIGGLCARSLRFSDGCGLEDVVVRHALGGRQPAIREASASGAMMLPVPARVPSVLLGVSGVDDARQVQGVDDVVISARAGETLVPLPEGSSYFGFVFARGATAVDVEHALRAAAARLRCELAPLIPVSR